MKVLAGEGPDRPAAFGSLACLTRVAGAELKVPAWMIVPAVRHRDLLLVIGQRQPGELGRDQVTGAGAGEQGAHVLPLPPVGPPRQPAVGLRQPAQEREEVPACVRCW